MVMEYYTVPPRIRKLRRRNQCRRRAAPTKLDRPTTITTSCPVVNKAVEIRQVWATNLITEFDKIRFAFLNGYNVIALDTEFPGSPHVPDGVDFDYRKRSCEDHYAVIKMNADRLKIIQVGITLMDAFGNLPEFEPGKRVAWEFNFSDFDIDEDECVKESVELLAKQGIDFQLHKEIGIKSTVFGRLMLLSGIIGCSAAWITFQGGIDLAYIMKMLIGGQPLPNNLEYFTAWVKHYFGDMVFDVKHMMKHCDNLYGGLNKVAETLKVERDAGESHRAGSDSLLTGMVFNKMVGVYFPAEEGQRFAGQIHNLV